jgi:hypothetical protein
MLDPLPLLPDPYTPPLSAYLIQHSLADRPPTLADFQTWIIFFQQRCAQNDLATAVRVLALPLAGRPLHHWLLEHEQVITPQA